MFVLGLRWVGTALGGEVEVLAVNARAAAIRERYTGEADCKYPGLPPNTGEAVQIVWKDGLIERFDLRPAAQFEADCASPAQTQRAEASLASVLQRSGLAGGPPVRWTPFVQQDRDTWSIAGGPTFRVLYQQPLSEVLSVGGTTVGGWAVDLPDELPMGFRSLVHRPVGVGASGDHHVAVFTCEYGVESWACALPYGGPAELRQENVSAWGRVEIQGVDLERGLIAYREFTSGPTSCAYPGLADPKEGVTLGVCAIRGSCEERVIYAAGPQCTPQDVAARALDAAKARSAELGLDRVVGGLSGCRTVKVGAPISFDTDGQRHTVEIREPGIVLWDGKPLNHDVARWTEPLTVCVDRGWAVVDPNPYVNGTGRSILATPFPVDNPPLR